MHKFFKRVIAGTAAAFLLCAPLWAEQASEKASSSNTQAIEEWIQKNMNNGGKIAEKLGDIPGASTSGDPKAIEKKRMAAAPEKAKESPETREMAAGEKESYRIQAGDKLTIKIFPEDPYIKGGDMQVSPDGNVTLPLLGKISLLGKTVNEAQEVLRQILNRDYLVDPEVTVEMMESKERSFVVLGQVKKPGTYQFPAGSTKFSLLEAISQAGGFSDIANSKKIKILRQQRDKTSAKKVIQANAEAIIGGQEPDVELEEGDVINVVESLF